MHWPLVWTWTKYVSPYCQRVQSDCKDPSSSQVPFLRAKPPLLSHPVSECVKIHIAIIHTVELEIYTVCLWVHQNHKARKTIDVIFTCDTEESGINEQKCYCQRFKVHCGRALHIKRDHTMTNFPWSFELKVDIKCRVTICKMLNSSMHAFNFEKCSSNI